MLGACVYYMKDITGRNCYGLKIDGRIQLIQERRRRRDLTNYKQVLDSAILLRSSEIVWSIAYSQKLFSKNNIISENCSSLLAEPTVGVII